MYSGRYGDILSSRVLIFEREVSQGLLWGARFPPFRTYLGSFFFIPGSILSIGTGLKAYTLPLRDSASVLNSCPPCLNQTLLLQAKKKALKAGS